MAGPDNPLLDKENRGTTNDTKVCVSCGALIRRDKRFDAKQWARQRACSKSCAQKKHRYDAPKLLADYVRGDELDTIAKRHAVPKYIIRHLVAKIGVSRRPDYDDHILRLRIFDGVKVNPLSACWEWQGMVNATGYGIITCRGKQKLAHRVSYAVFRGGFDLSSDVCHKCDNRACINPDHLFVGDRAANMRDAGEKGRVAKGSQLPQTRLTRDQVETIRQQYAAGVSVKELAEKYEISSSHICNIIRYRAWK